MKQLTYESPQAGSVYFPSSVKMLIDSSFLNIWELLGEIQRKVGALDKLVEVSTERKVYSRPRIGRMPIVEATLALGGEKTEVNLVARVQTYPEGTEISNENLDRTYSDRIVVVTSEDTLNEYFEQYFQSKGWLNKQLRLEK